MSTGLGELESITTGMLLSVGSDLMRLRTARPFSLGSLRMTARGSYAVRALGDGASRGLAGQIDQRSNRV